MFSSSAQNLQDSSLGFTASKDDPGSWYADLHGRIFKLTDAVPKLELGPSGCPLAQPVYQAQIASPEPFAVGGRAVVFRASLWSPSFQRFCESDHHVLRIIKSTGFVHIRDQFMHMARHRLGLAITRKESPHLVGTIAVGAQDGYQSLELCRKYIPASLMLIGKVGRDIINAHPSEREVLIGSCLKTILTSISEVNELQDEYIPSVPGASDTPFPRVLVHGDVKVENLVLDTACKTLRLTDFDSLAVIQARRDPIDVERATTISFASPELQRGQLSEKSDSYMAAVTVFRFFFSPAGLPVLPLSKASLSQVLNLPSESPVLSAIAGCLERDHAKRMYPDDALRELSHLPTDKFAEYLTDLYERHSNLRNPAGAVESVIYRSFPASFPRLSPSHRHFSRKASSSSMVATNTRYPPPVTLEGPLPENDPWKTSVVVSYLHKVHSSPSDDHAKALSCLHGCTHVSRRETLFNHISSLSGSVYEKAAAASWILREFLRQQFSFDAGTCGVSQLAIDEANAIIRKLWPSRAGISISASKLSKLLSSDSDKLGHVFLKIGLAEIVFPTTLQKVRDMYGFFGEERVEAVKVLVATYFVRVRHGDQRHASTDFKG